MLISEVTQQSKVRSPNGEGTCKAHTISASESSIRIECLGQSAQQLDRAINHFVLDVNDLIGEGFCRYAGQQSTTLGHTVLYFEVSGASGNFENGKGIGLSGSDAYAAIWDRYCSN